jgi:hypothetical protein
VLQSGKKTGKSIEQLMFSDYGWLVYMRGLLNRSKPATKNRMHQHIEWALERGQTRKPTKMCPQCGKDPVTYFSYLGNEKYGYSMSSAYTCCGNKECMRQLRAQGIEKVPTFLPITFSSITHFQLKHDQKQVAALLKDCFMLPKRVTKELLFAFFNE